MVQGKGLSGAPPEGMGAHVDNDSVPAAGGCLFNLDVDSSIPLRQDQQPTSTRARQRSASIGI